MCCACVVNAGPCWWHEADTPSHVQQAFGCQAAGAVGYNSPVCSHLWQEMRCAAHYAQRIKQRGAHVGIGRAGRSEGGEQVGDQRLRMARQDGMEEAGV